MKTTSPQTTGATDTPESLADILRSRANPTCSRDPGEATTGIRSHAHSRAATAVAAAVTGFSRTGLVSSWPRVMLFIVLVLVLVLVRQLLLVLLRLNGTI